MNKHLFKLLFGTLFLVAATAFTGCSDDEDTKSGAPTLKATPETVNITEETGLTQTVNVEANCEWKIDKSGLDWATITPMSGKGDAKITITAEELATGSREGKFSFTLIHPEYGKWATGESPVTVKQFANGIQPPPTGNAVYSNNFDKEPATQTFGTTKNKWPFLDEFEGWKNETPAGATYEFTAMSARANSFSNDSHSKYEGSGSNNIFFGSGASFTIKNIALTSAQSKLRLTFGSYRSIFEATDNGFVTSEFHVFLSKDGAAWTEITYERPVGEDEHTKYGTWALATADFTLKEVPAELYIKFTSDLASSHRIDDVKLVEGIGGQEVVFGEAPDPDKVVSVADVHAAATEGTFTVQGQIVAVNASRFMLKDDTGLIEVNLGWKDNATIVKYVPEIGQTVKVKATSASYSNIRQLNTTEAAPAEVTKVSDGSYTQPTPVKWVASDFQAYASATSRTIQYIEYAGELVVDGAYYNVIIDGLDKTKLMGGISYPTEGFVKPISGDMVVVKGYVNGMTNKSTIVSFMAVSVELDSNASADPKITAVSPTALTFAATDVAKKVTVTARNADGCTLDASADNAQFTVAVNGMEVTVTPQENTTDAAITATLTIKLMKDGAAVDTKTVAVTQNKKASEPSGDEKTIELTQAEIKSIGGKSGSYASFTFTNDAGEWLGMGAGGTTGKECIAINVKDNSAFGSHVQIPTVNGIIQKIEVTIISPYKERAIGVFPVDYTYTKASLAEMKAQLAADAIAVSNETPADVNNTQPFTFIIEDLGAKNLSQVKLFPTLGAINITNIKVTYK